MKVRGELISRSGGVYRGRRPFRQKKTKPLVKKNQLDSGLPDWGRERSLKLPSILFIDRLVRRDTYIFAASSLT